MSSCALRVDDQNDPVAAVVTGELDRTNAEKFVDEVKAVPGTRPLILDLSELRFIDSAGFSAVIRMLEQHLVVIVLAPVSFCARPRR